MHMNSFHSLMYHVRGQRLSCSHASLLCVCSSMMMVPHTNKEHTHTIPHRSQPLRCLTLTGPKARVLDFLRCIPEGIHEQKRRLLDK